MKLGEVTTLFRGKYITRDSVVPGDVPVILGGKEPAYYCDEANHEGPCFVISRSGASAGYVSYWNEPIFVTDGFLFDAKPEADIRYLYYCLKSQQQALADMQNGAGIPHVRGEELKQREIPFPPLPTQRRIADILSAYDDKIANNRRRMELLEESARLLYRKMFGDDVADAVNWPVVKIGDILGKAHRAVKIPKEEYCESGAYPCIDQSREFIGGYTNNEAAVNHDLPAIVFGDHTRILKFVRFPFASGADGTQLIRSNDSRISQEFLYYALREIDLTNYFYARHFKILKSKDLRIPPFELIEEFTSFVSPMTERIEVLLKENIKLAEARDILLPQLMSGKMEVV